jgi:hypothetical protein
MIQFKNEQNRACFQDNGEVSFQYGQKKKCVSGQTVPPKLMRPCGFFLLSEIPDGEMVVNLILRYEKNGI